jgi:MFS family permease
MFCMRRRARAGRLGPELPAAGLHGAGDTASEADALFVPDLEAVDRRDRRIQVAALFLICGIICGTYCWAALLPAFEQDASLEWSPATTSQLNTLTQASEMAGLFVAGPLADHVPAKTLLALEIAILCATLLNVSLSTTSTVIVTLVMPIFFLKGILWPTVGAIVSANVSAPRQDQTFFIAALGSRTGDILSAMVLGFLLECAGLTWRHALTVLLVVVMTILFAAGLQMPRRIAAPQDVQELSLNGVLEKWGRLVVSLDAWLAFLTLFGTYACWTLLGYLPVILQDTYNLTPGQAALSVGIMSAGMALGLVSGILAESFLARDTVRAVTIVQGSSV